MRVIDRIEQLRAELQEFYEEYCDNCQEFQCDECRREWRGEEE